MKRIFLFVLTIGLTTGISLAQDVDLGKLDEITEAQKKQEAIEQEISEKRSKVQTEIRSLKNQLTALSADIKKLETENNRLEDQLAQLNLDQATLEKDITQNRSKLSEFLATLQRIEDNPPPPLATSPNDAANAARAAILTSSISQQLNSRVDTLNQKLEQLENVRAEIGDKQSALNLNKSEIERKHSATQNLVSSKNLKERDLSKDFEAAQRRSTELANEAKSLRDLIERLERQTPDFIPRLKPDPSAPDTSATTSAPKYQSKPLNLQSGALRFAQAKGRVITPVIGSLSKRYSRSHPGLAVKASNRSQVVAPIGGRVEFAGPFKNYDKVVILNVGDGYFLLLTGLGELYVQNGAYVDAAEPVGLMPVNSHSTSNLYIEVRKNGSTIDPTPWFGTSFANRRNG